MVVKKRKTFPARVRAKERSFGKAARGRARAMEGLAFSLFHQSEITTVSTSGYPQVLQHLLVAFACFNEWLATIR